MKNESSDRIVEQQLEILKEIRQVEVPEDLYGRITRQIGDRVRSVVPLHWVGAAAAGIALLILIDVFAIRNNSQSQSEQTTEQLIPVTNNALYHE